MMKNLLCGKGTKVSNHNIASIYRIDGTVNLDTHPSLKNPNNCPNFQKDFESFKLEILTNIRSRNPVSYYKFGDGDYYFLKGKAIGSAMPGRRALSRKLSKTELAAFQNGANQCDKYLCEMYPENKRKFKEVIHDRSIDYQAEFVYGIVASRWVTSLPYKIGLIGASNKLKIIQELCRSEVYQSYIGREKFDAYIEIPQKFACDNLDARLLEIQNQISQSDCDLYLLGVGHLKSGILHKLKSFKNGVYLDVGSGIDALAGVIDPMRPYFGDWINYRSARYELYENLDLLNFDGQNTSQLPEL